MAASNGQRRRWLLAWTALAFYLLARWGLNTWVYPTFHETLPAARELATAVEVLACAALIAIVLRSGYGTTVVRFAHLWSPLALVAALALFYGGVALAQPWLLAAGAVLYGVGGLWLYISAASTLVELTPRFALLAVIASGAAQWAISGVFLSGGIADSAGFVFQGLFCLGCLGCSWKAAARIPAMMEEHVPGAMALFVNPRSFVPAGHPLFVSVVLSGLVCGVALTYGSNLSVPVQTPLSVVPLLVIEGLALAVLKRGRALDTLYLGATLLVLAGLVLFFPALSTGARFDVIRQLPNMLFSAGSNCLLALALLVSGAIGHRNPADFLRIAALYAGSICLGILGGALAGHALNFALAEHVDVVSWGFSTSAIVFAGYNLVLVRTFSFDEVVAQVHPVDAPRIVAPSASFDERCRAIVEAFGLTAREAEIFHFYARGRSTAVVQEELVLSYNTVKTHVRNIYRKTDVHSQQELIDLVDRWEMS